MYRIALFLFFSAFLFACSDDDLSDNKCGANGTRDELTETCICDSFYDGENCEMETRAKFIDTWITTNSTCTDQDGNELLPSWIIDPLDNIDGISIRSEIVCSNMGFDAGLSADNMAELLPVGDILGNITIVNDSSLNFSISSIKLECSFDLVKQ